MISLAPLHSFALNYQAADILTFDSVEDLREVAKHLDIFNKPHIILGSGTNTIFSSDYNGCVIKLESHGLSTHQDDEYFYLTVEAGYEWHQLVKWTLANGIFGLENLALIPGTVGAAPIQNIGAYGIEFSDICDYVEYLDKHSLEIVRLNCDELHLGYRDSIFKQQLMNKTVICKVGLKLKKQWQPITSYSGLSGLNNANQIFDAVVALRQSKLPNHIKMPNAGSFFKNPVIDKVKAKSLRLVHHELPLYAVTAKQFKIPAAWLIEQCGLKGRTIGDIAIYQHHALILTNTKSGTGAQLLDLVELIRNSVLKHFDIRLEPEVKIIGQSGELDMDTL
ncbi:MAG: UDP-N-acetylmuramate dehydrogenase [Algicola sp.]|nr:UDP-N-acetylmuramate dehydrogenase [Algicola sp.]